MILACQGICKAFGEEVIVKNGSFHIEEHKRLPLWESTGQERLLYLR